MKKHYVTVPYPFDFFVRCLVVVSHAFAVALALFWVCTDARAPLRSWSCLPAVWRQSVRARHSVFSRLCVALVTRLGDAQRLCLTDAMDGAASPSWRMLLCKTLTKRSSACFCDRPSAVAEVCVALVVCTCSLLLSVCAGESRLQSLPGTDLATRCSAKRGDCRGPPSAHRAGRVLPPVCVLFPPRNCVPEAVRTMRRSFAATSATATSAHAMPRCSCTSRCVCHGGSRRDCAFTLAAGCVAAGSAASRELGGAPRCAAGRVRAQIGRR